MSAIQGRRTPKGHDKAYLMDLEPIGDLPVQRITSENWEYIVEYRGDAWQWWATETHILTDPMIIPWRPLSVGHITGDPATWLGTHVAWVGK